MKTVLTLGSFEIFHRGHVRLIQKCYQYSDEVIVGLNSDRFIHSYKGHYPVLDWKERKDAIQAVFCDIVVVQNDQPDGSIVDVLDAVIPNIIVIGSDWLRKPYLPQLGLKPEDLEDRGIDLIYVPYTPNISTTEIKKRILK